MEKRLLLNKNVQLYHLVSLFTPAGIVFYRKILKNQNPKYDIPEVEQNYWNGLNQIINQYNSANIKYINIDDYIQNDLLNDVSVLKKIDDIDFIKTRKRNELHPVLKPILEKVIKSAPKKNTIIT